MLQVGQSSSAIRLAFEQFETVDVSFHRPATVGKRESRQKRGFVALDTAGKGEEFPEGGRTHVLEPGVKSFTAVVANEVQEAVSQLSCLRESAIHLRDLIQLCLGLWTKFPWTGQHPPDDLRLPSRLRKASERLTQAKQAIPARVDARAIWPDADTHCGEGIV